MGVGLAVLYAKVPTRAGEPGVQGPRWPRKGTRAGTAGGQSLSCLSLPLGRPQTSWQSCCEHRTPPQMAKGRVASFPVEESPLAAWLWQETGDEGCAGSFLLGLQPASFEIGCSFCSWLFFAPACGLPLFRRHQAWIVLLLFLPHSGFLRCLLFRIFCLMAPSLQALISLKGPR